MQLDAGMATNRNIGAFMQMNPLLQFALILEMIELIQFKRAFDFMNMEKLTMQVII